MFSLFFPNNRLKNFLLSGFLILLSLNSGDVVYPQRISDEPVRHITYEQFGSPAPANFRAALVRNNRDKNSYRPLAKQENTAIMSQIELHSGFFKPLKFTINDSKSENVYGFTGLSFTTDFQETMSEYPPALKEARKAFTYNAVSLIGWIGMTAFSLKFLLSTINDASTVSSGQIPEDDSHIGDVVLIGVSGGVAIIFGILGKSQLEKGVEIFNKRN